MRAIGTTGRAELPAGDRNPLDFGDASPRGSYTVGMVGVFPALFDAGYWASGRWRWRYVAGVWRNPSVF